MERRERLQKGPRACPQKGLSPEGPRKGSAIPSVLRLHYADIGTSEIETIDDVRVTKALRSILDVWQEESLPESSLRDAFEDAKRLGKLTRSEIALARRDPRIARVIDSLEQGRR